MVALYNLIASGWPVSQSCKVIWNLFMYFMYILYIWNVNLVRHIMIFVNFINESQKFPSAKYSIVLYKDHDVMNLMINEGHNSWLQQWH